MTWLGRLVRRTRAEAELAAELRDHLERRVTDLVQDGMEEPEARRLAGLELGGIEQLKEDCRDARGTRWAHDLAHDLRYGVRVLGQTPIFTAVAVLSLALGIGANSAIFSMVNGLLLRTLPVQDPSRLVLLDGGSWTNPLWEQVRDRRAAFAEAATAWGTERFDLARGGQSEFVDGLYASGGYFETLGVRAMLGRTFTPADDRRGGGPDGPVAVISYRWWQARFGGAADIIGRPLSLNRARFTIIGVTPPGFLGPVVGRGFDVTVPLGTVDLFRDGPENALDSRSWWWLDIMLRLKPGETIEEATRALRGLQPQIREATMPQDWRVQDLESYLRDGFTLVSAAAGPSELRKEYERPLLTLMAVVGLVLFIACANIANLLLARATARRHELAMRRALGASGFRLARQLLAESLLLSAAGAVVGLLFARWGTSLLVSQLSTFRAVVTLDVPLDWRVLAFTAAVTIMTALVFGIAPALRAARVDPNDALKQQGRSLTGDSRRGLATALVIAQVALSLVLVVAAGLFVRTFATLATVDTGFDRDPVLIVTVDAQHSEIEPADRVAFFERLRKAAAAVPGVAGAGASFLTPASGMGWNSSFESLDTADLPEQERVVWFNAVSAGYFKALGTVVLEGRDFTDGDRAGAARVAIVNQAFVRKYIKGPSALGHIFTREGPPGSQKTQLEVIGVVEDAVYRSPRDGKPPTVYLALQQRSEASGEPVMASVNIVVRAAGTGSPMLLSKSLADVLARVEPSVSLTFRPLAEQFDALFVRERLVAVLSAFFGGLALLMAAIGLYGVTAYAVSCRRTEIGVRMALGADAGRVVRLVLGRVAWLVGAGVAVGLVISVWASRFVSSLLYGLEATDATTLTGAAAVLATVAALAAWLPARRAARIDPAEVLRNG